MKRTYRCFVMLGAYCTSLVQTSLFSLRCLLISNSKSSPKIPYFLSSMEAIIKVSFWYSVSEIVGLRRYIFVNHRIVADYSVSDCTLWCHITEAKHYLIVFLPHILEKEFSYNLTIDRTLVWLPFNQRIAIQWLSITVINEQLISISILVDILRNSFVMRSINQI